MIRITDKYFIDADKYNVILKEKVVMSDKSKTPGQITFKEIGYYPNLQSALIKLNESFKKEMIENYEFINIGNAILQLNDLQREFASQVSSLNIEIKAVDSHTDIK